MANPSETDPPLPHMSMDEFRQRGYELIDWIANHLENLEDLPVGPSVEPGEIRAGMAATVPEQPEDFGEILSDLDRVVVPGLANWQHPNWFAYFPASSSPAAILGELASAGLGEQGMLWSSSPACTEVESAVMDWLVDLMGLPAAWRNDTGPGGGVIQSTASDSTHTAIAVARIRAQEGVPLDSLVAYCSDQTHSAFEKGARVAGVRHARAIATDAEHALDMEQLRTTIDADVANGLVPFLINSTMGTTATCAVDPLPAICDVAEQHGMWHHVDAAYAGTYMMCPELRFHQPDLDRLDSYSFNPHKAMLTNMDCSAFWVRDRKALIGALSILPPFLRDASSNPDVAIDYRDWHVPLGRRFRSLKLWFVLRSYGAEGLRNYLRMHVQWAQWLAQQIDEHPKLRVFAPQRFGLVTLAHVDGNDATDALTEALHRTGNVYLTPSTIGDDRFLRVSIGSTWTQRRHVEQLWDTINQLLKEI